MYTRRPMEPEIGPIEGPLGESFFFGPKALRPKEESSAMDTLEEDTFEALSPSRFISFSLPSPDGVSSSLLRFAVLDSSSPPPAVPKTAALLVPKGRHRDWIFSTERGHHYLLLNSPGISRLILVGDPIENPATVYSRPKIDDASASLQEKLLPILLALSPKKSFRGGIPGITFISYDEDLIRSVPVVVRTGPEVGDLLVEDVEVESNAPPARDFRRRLRFKRSPNLIQTEVRLVPAGTDSIPQLGVTKFRPDTSFLLMPYLAAMAAGLSLVGPTLESRARPRVLCVGVGGGSLLMFLRAHFELDVLGLEIDATALEVARKYFDLVEDEFLRVRLGDGIEIMKDFGKLELFWNGDRRNDKDGDESLMDVIMVDLDSSDANGLSAPPLEFVQRQVLMGARSAMSDRGVFIINVIPQSKRFYTRILDDFRAVFAELYEIDVGNGENFVVIATASPLGDRGGRRGSSIEENLEKVLEDDYLRRTKKI